MTWSFYKWKNVNKIDRIHVYQPVIENFKFKFWILDILFDYFLSKTRWILIVTSVVIYESLSITDFTVDIQSSRKDWNRKDWHILRNFSKFLKFMVRAEMKEHAYFMVLVLFSFCSCLRKFFSCFVLVLEQEYQKIIKK